MSTGCGGKNFIEGLDLRMNQTPACANPIWGKPEDTRLIELYAFARITYNHLQSPIVEEKLSARTIKEEEIKFTRSEIEKYDGDRKLKTFKEDLYGIIMTTEREIEDGYNEWSGGTWCDTKRIFKYCEKTCNNQTHTSHTYQHHFDTQSDMVSEAAQKWEI